MAKTDSLPENLLQQQAPQNLILKVETVQTPQQEQEKNQLKQAVQAIQQTQEQLVTKVKQIPKPPACKTSIICSHLLWIVMTLCLAVLIIRYMDNSMELQRMQINSQNHHVDTMRKADEADKAHEQIMSKPVEMPRKECKHSFFGFYTTCTETYDYVIPKQVKEDKQSESDEQITL